MSSSVSNVDVPALAGEVGDDLAALQALVGGRVGVADHVAPPVGEPREHAGLGRLGPRRQEPARTAGSRSFAIRSGTGRLITSDQPGSMNSAQ